MTGESWGCKTRGVGGKIFTKELSSLAKAKSINLPKITSRSYPN